jgi:hypothetical protein
MWARVLNAFSATPSAPKSPAKIIPPPADGTSNTDNKQIMVVPGDGFILHRHLAVGGDNTSNNDNATDTGTPYVFLPQAVFGNQQPRPHEPIKHAFVVPSDAHEAKGKYIYFVGDPPSSTS